MFSILGAVERQFSTFLAARSVLPHRRLSHVVTALGDSRVAAVYADLNQRIYSGYSPLNWANALSDQRMVIGTTFGVSGDRTDQALARLSAAIATGAGTLYIQCGLNDIAQQYPTAGTSGATAAANIMVMAEAARAVGMLVVIEIEVGSSAMNTAALVGQVVELNERLYEYAERTPGVHFEPDTPRAQLAGGEHVERPGQHNGDRHRDDGRNHADGRTRRPAEIAGEPEHHAPNTRCVGDRQHHADECAGCARDNDTRQQQARGAAAPGKKVNNRDRSECTRDRAELGRRNGGAQDHREQRADGRAARDAEHEGIRQRVSEERLKQHARNGEQPTHTERRQQARQADVEQHATSGLVTGTRERGKRATQSDPGRADQQRGSEDRDGQRQQRDETASRTRSKPNGTRHRGSLAGR